MPSPPTDSINQILSSVSVSASASPPPLSSPNKNTWYPFSNGTDFDSKIAMILIILICALVCALAINAAIRFFLRSPQPTPPSSSSSSGDHDHDHDRLPVSDPHKTTHTPPPTLISPPTLVFSEGMKLSGAECAICLSEFVKGEGVRVLPVCKHGFHSQCIQAWLSSHASCPTCRTSCLTSSPDNSLVRGENEVDIESPSQVPTQQRD